MPRRASSCGRSGTTALSPTCSRSRKSWVRRFSASCRQRWVKPSCDAPQLGFTHLCRQDAENLRTQLFLDREQVGERAVVPLRPQLLARLGVAQVHLQPQTLADTLHRPGDDVAAFRSPRLDADDLEAADFGQIGHEVRGDTPGQHGLPQIVGERLERPDSDRGLCADGVCRRGAHGRRGALALRPPERCGREQQRGDARRRRPARARASGGRSLRHGVLRTSHRSDQAVASLRDRLDVGGILRGVAEGLAQLDDDLRYGIVADDDPGPDRREQRLAADDLSGPGCEVDQDRHRLGLELHGLALGGELKEGGLDRPFADLKSGTARGSGIGDSRHGLGRRPQHTELCGVSSSSPKLRRFLRTRRAGGRSNHRTPIVAHSKENTMNVRGRAIAAFLGAFLAAAAVGPAQAVEVGEPAPEFSMKSTAGSDIALKDFHGKKWVLLEFYGADFSPACAANLSARKADYKRFEALGVQNLATSANLSFSQQTFAESLGLPFPLLSDFPERRTMRAYGVLNEKLMVANRSFFLIDPQGVVRKKWMVENPVTTVVYSDGVLRDIREIVAKR